VNNPIELSWISPQDIDADVHLVVNGNAIDMKVETSIEIENIDNMSVVVGNVDSFMNPVPEQFALSAAYPNPFNPSTTISYDVPSDMNINLAVYDIRGRMVTELANGMREQGRYDVIWNAENQSSGVYFMKLVAGNTMKTQKMMLVK
jgi:hypothetical protein